MEKVVICCDGGCRGNQNDGFNIGGWGTILVWCGRRKELYGGERNTTNNKMELVACIKGLEAFETIKNISIEVMSDSAYLINCMTNRWYVGWKRNGWRNSSKEPVKNQELWERLLQLIEGREIQWIKVKGHSDHELNIIADRLANVAMDEIKEKELKKVLTKIN